jgi:uncharacterized protein (DUF2235 family)
MGKNIIVFSDGTGQKGGVGSNTNVYKLFNMIENRTDDQIAFYDPGLGTDWRKITGSIAGRGFSKNILDCYKFIFENFKAKDNIFLFGFSRGAATVRSLSYFIHLFGILPKSRPDLIKKAFKIYKIRDDNKRERRATDFINRHHTMWTKIKFVGVWDTVAALGLPIKWMSYIIDRFIPHTFHSFGLCDCIEYARHALSIDDERKTFHPVLWNDLEANQPKDRMKQVWFCGVHSDVGGGYEKEDLSNLTLGWMIKEATDKGLKIYKKSPAFQKLLNAKPDVNGWMHNEQEKIPGKLFRREVRKWENRKSNPCIHMSVFERTKNNINKDNPQYSPWILNLVDRNNPCNEPWDRDVLSTI